MDFTVYVSTFGQTVKPLEGYIPIGTEYYTDLKGVTISHRYLCDENIVKETKILLGQ